MQKIALTWPGAAIGAKEKDHLGRWCEEYFECYGGVEIAADWDQPSSLTLQYLGLGPFGLRVERAGAIEGFHRRREHIARDGDDRFTLIVNRGNAPTQRIAESRPGEVGVGSSVLFDRSECSIHACPGGSDRLVLIMPRRAVCGALPNPEDHVGLVIPPGNEALRMLVRYADGLLEEDDWSDPAVLEQAGQSLLDLAVLAFGSNRDNTETASQRGLRAARLAVVLRIIRADFTDPQITPEAVAQRVGISTRYLHHLLHETGSSFSERIMELRLDKAFAQIAGGSAKRISDIAYEAGFSDLSYFNRSFRRRYGLTPTAARGAR